MQIGCPHCDSRDIARRRRKGVLDQIRATFNSWPYRCLDCGKCFRAHQRRPASYSTPPAASASAPKKPKAAAAAGNAPGPRAAYQTDQVRPYAKIVLEADNHQQMDAILLALDQAVSRYSGTAKQQSGSAKGSQR